MAADVRATHTQSVVHHDALQDPKCELWPALVHDDAGYDEVHALAVADILVVQAVSAQDVTFFSGESAGRTHARLTSSSISWPCPRCTSADPAAASPRPPPPTTAAAACASSRRDVNLGALWKKRSSGNVRWMSRRILSVMLFSRGFWGRGGVRRRGRERELWSRGRPFRHQRMSAVEYERAMNRCSKHACVSCEHRRSNSPALRCIAT